jgi:hypothetical protein
VVAAPDAENDFETWAKLAARVRLLDGGPREQLLASLGLSDRWAAIHEHWSNVLTSEIVSGQLERASYYKALCVAEMSAEASAGVSEGSFRDELQVKPVVAPRAGQLKTRSMDFRAALSPRAVGRPVRQQQVTLVDESEHKSISAFDLLGGSTAAPTVGFTEDLQAKSVVRPSRNQVMTMGQIEVERVIDEETGGGCDADSPPTVRVSESTQPKEPNATAPPPPPHRGKQKSAATMILPSEWEPAVGGDESDTGSKNGDG